MSEAIAAVNAQMTDSVTQVNTQVIGDAPAMAMGNLLVSTSHALSTGSHNVTASQQQGQMTMHAATVQGSECSDKCWLFCNRKNWRRNYRKVINNLIEITQHH